MERPCQQENPCGSRECCSQSQPEMSENELSIIITKGTIDPRVVCFYQNNLPIQLQQDIYKQTISCDQTIPMCLQALEKTVNCVLAVANLSSTPTLSLATHTNSLQQTQSNQ